MLIVMPCIVITSAGQSTTKGLSVSQALEEQEDVRLGAPGVEKGAVRGFRQRAPRLASKHTET